MALKTLIIEDSKGNRGEAVISEYINRPKIVKWTMISIDGQIQTSHEGGTVPKSLHKALFEFADRFQTPKVPRGGGTHNTWTAFRCSGCLTPRQTRRDDLTARPCPNSEGHSFEEPYRVRAKGDGTCW